MKWFRNLDKKKHKSQSVISKIAVILMFFIPLIMMNCEKEIKTLVTPDDSQFPSAPINITVVINDGSILLTWEMANNVGIHCFHIYRKDSVAASMTLIDSSFVNKYKDSNVRNGRTYYYQVAAVNNQGYEGKVSQQISARPNLFGVIIENGNLYTNKKLVTLSLTAPVGTQYMSLANDSLFTNSKWEYFMSTKTWTLSQGDGEKQVFVKFRDYEGNVSQDRIFDSIILDTKAVISEVTENTNGQTKVPGQVIHFALNAGEQDGKATIDIGNIARGIKLYDDGTNGDLGANDGIYEVNYQIPLGIQIVNAIITGHFTDRANNIAENVTAAGRVTIQQDPLAVTLYPPAATGTPVQSLELYWSQSTDNDFASYRLYRKTTSGVDTSSFLVATITTKQVTNFNDQNVNEGIDYYYRVFVFDIYGGAKGSNEVMGQVDEDNENPAPVTLLSATPLGNSLTSLHLTWSKNSDTDFESYRIYRTKAPEQVDSTSFLVNIIYDQNITNYDDTGLEENTEYNYKIYVFDAGGKSAGSNKVTGKTNADELPIPVTLLTPTPVGNSTNSLTLNWSKNADEDFNSYRIYRTEAPTPVDSNSFVVDIIYNQSVTNYEDTNLKEDTEYNYRVYVFDEGGNSAGSNMATGKTNVNEPPTPVTLLTPTAVSNSTTSLNLNWSKNTDADFTTYTIYRAEAPTAVDSNSFVVDIINNQNITDYQDTNLKEDTEYNYRIYVFDEGGKSTGSNMVAGKTNVNEPPNPVTLLIPAPVGNSTTSLNLSWSENADSDFDSYRIYREEAPAAVDSSSFVVDIINNQNITDYQDTNLKENTEYNYRVYVFDKGGKSTGSNTATGKTNANQPPTAVILAQPLVVDSTTLSLSWSINDDQDFDFYKIYRSETSPVDTTIAPIAIISNQNTTQYLDSNLIKNKTYYYRVFVVDQGGLSSGSNEASATPKP